MERMHVSGWLRRRSAAIFSLNDSLVANPLRPCTQSAHKRVYASGRGKGTLSVEAAATLAISLRALVRLAGSLTSSRPILKRVVRRERGKEGRRGGGEEAGSKGSAEHQKTRAAKNGIPNIEMEVLTRLAICKIQVAVGTGVTHTSLLFWQQGWHQAPNVDAAGVEAAAHRRRAARGLKHMPETWVRNTDKKQATRLEQGQETWACFTCPSFPVYCHSDNATFVKKFVLCEKAAYLAS